MEKLTHKGLIGSLDYIKDDNGNLEVVYIHTNWNNEGECYKDDWDCGDIIYISEYSAMDFANRPNNGCNLEDIAWTKESWIDWVNGELEYEGIYCREFAEYIAKFIYDITDWEDLSTRFTEWENNNDVKQEYYNWKNNGKD